MKRMSISRDWPIHLRLAGMFIILPFIAHAADLIPVPELGLRIPRGFRLTLYADSDLANDIYAMALDARGNVVVTSQGYVKMLLDRNGDGFADGTVPLIRTRTGGMGMCFDGTDLWFMGDGALSRFRDTNDDELPDGPGQRLLSFNFLEHGGHAMRKGPDGWWYVVAGNETRFTADHSSLATSPVQAIEGGALLRLEPNGRGSEVVAHGFRNPYDFDFNVWGDIFTYDSDTERDVLLPWYLPTRAYHVQTGGGHHGWRLEGWIRSWPRPPYYPDSIEMLAPIGRGSPTGVTCYRHLQFPDHYRNGLFIADWTFGRVYFLPLQSSHSTYATQPEIFIEPIGTHGFAPTDLAVAPDGSLFVSIGGRKTRGAVYRLQYMDSPSLWAQGTNWMNVAPRDAGFVLRMPQPLDAWSRAVWMPEAQRLGAEPFLPVILSRTVDPALRCRAIEIMTELFDGLPFAVAAEAARAESPQVRQRVAWSLGRAPSANIASVLSGLANDADASVRNHALQAMCERVTDLDARLVSQTVIANSTHADRRVRQAAARLAMRLPVVSWQALWRDLRAGLPQGRLTGVMAALDRADATSVHTQAIEVCLGVLNQTRVDSERLQAVRLIILALGDYHLHDPSEEVYTAYEPALSLGGHEALVRRVDTTVSALIPSGDRFVDFEAARLLAMVQSTEPDLSRRLGALIHARSSATSDFHYLTVLSRLKAKGWREETAYMANAILSLDQKLEGQQLRTKQSWTDRLVELAERLMQRDPKLPDALLQHPHFATPGNLALVPLFDPDKRIIAARLYAAALRTKPFSWSGQLIDVLTGLPAADVRPLLRQQWANIALRDRLVTELAKQPEQIDHPIFVAGLSSLHMETVRASLSALSKLRLEPSDATTLAALRLLRRLLNEPKEHAVRSQALALINSQSKQSFKIQEQNTDPTALRRAYQPVFGWAARDHPTWVSHSEPQSDDDGGNWNFVLKSTHWDQGNAGRGEVIYRERGCQTCHSTANPLGPDLAGAASRMSVMDLFHSIIFPNRDVAAPYRMTTFQMRDGSSHIGFVAFQSADGVILQTGATTTVRLSEADIVHQQPSALSLMPGGLLAGLSSQGLADLYSYLKTLRTN